MDQSDKFWDKIAERYAKQPVADETSYQKKLEVTRGYLQADMELLEFGCGTGSTAIIHAPLVKHIQAIDVSAKMLQIARGKAKAGNINNITFDQATIENFNTPDQSLDVVLGLSVLHLLEDKEKVLAKVRNILKPGGLFISSTACLGDTLWFIKFIVPIGKLFGFMPSVKVFTVEQLTDALSKAGFVISYQWQPGKSKAVFIVAQKVG